MCALTGVTLGLIQPGKGHSEVTENGNRKSVMYTARATTASSFMAEFMYYKDWKIKHCCFFV